MNSTEIVGIVLAAVSIVLLAVTLFLLNKVYIVIKRDKMPRSPQPPPEVEGSPEAPGG